MLYYNEPSYENVFKNPVMINSLCIFSAKIVLHYTVCLAQGSVNLLNLQDQTQVLK